MGSTEGGCVCRSHHGATPADVVRGLTAGVIGGLIGTIVMTQFQTWANALAQRLKPAARDSHGNGKTSETSEPEASEPATTKAATAIATAVLHRPLEPTEKETAGSLVHYGFGTTMGGLYGMIAEVSPQATVCAGTLFGTGLWLVADELAVPLTRLGSSPLQTPLSVHTYAWASHLVYGFTTDAVRRSVRALL